MTIEVSAHLGSRLQDAGYLEESAFWVSNSFRFCFILKGPDLSQQSHSDGKPTCEARPEASPVQQDHTAISVCTLGLRPRRHRLLRVEGPPLPEPGTQKSGFAA